jgi:hypothetical protein
VEPEGQAVSGISGLPNPPPPRSEVVRVVTSYWSDKKGFHFRKSLIPLRRKSHGHQVLEEDVSMVGFEEVIPRILNLSECEDGVYDVVICNEKKDWETGCVEEWDYKLLPYRE